MKHLNRLEQVLAAAELAAAGADEGILLDHEEFLISAISSNIFLVSEQQLLTPRLDRCGVRGVVRGRIVKEFKSRCELRRVSLDMLPEAEEVFLCNTVRGIIPVLSIDDHQFKPGPVTRELQEWMADSGGRP
jgi:4-amino-4-deoxychorismate lyase